MNAGPIAAALRCYRCEPHGGHNLLDIDTPLPTLDPMLLCDLAEAHDEAEHGGRRDQKIYDALAASIVLLQARHG